MSECKQIQKIVQLPDVDGPTLNNVKERLRNGLSCYLWSLSEVTQIEPIPIRVTRLRFRNRHFTMPITALKSGIDIEPPREQSLYSASWFFLKLLQQDEYKLLQRTAQALNGRKVRVGTTCSGCDVGVTCVKSVIKMMNREFRVSCLQVVRKTCIHTVTFSHVLYTYIKQSLWHRGSKCGGLQLTT